MTISGYLLAVFVPKYLSDVPRFFETAIMVKHASARSSTVTSWSAEQVCDRLIE